MGLVPLGETGEKAGVPGGEANAIEGTGVLAILLGIGLVVIDAQERSCSPLGVMHQLPTKELNQRALCNLLLHSIYSFGGSTRRGLPFPHNTCIIA